MTKKAKDFSHVREKIGRTARALMVGTGTIQERLESAYRAISTLAPIDFPNDLLVTLWTNILQAKGDKGDLRATLSDSDKSDQERIAARAIRSLSGRRLPCGGQSLGFRDLARGHLGGHNIAVLGGFVIPLGRR
jgi:hypothetical protein